LIQKVNFPRALRFFKDIGIDDVALAIAPT